jgi:hypothetical protein
MYETNKVAIVRKVYSAAAGPRLGCLIPHIKAEYEDIALARADKAIAAD